MFRTLVFGVCCALAASSASAASTCEHPVPLGALRHLRQVYLDLLGRPPTIEEYRAAENKGPLTTADIEALMTSEEFYQRNMTYHRALLRTNVNSSVYNNLESRLARTNDGAKPLEARNIAANILRGRPGTGCDHFVDQDNCNAVRQDPHLEPAVKMCRDPNGVPMPVSVDYDNTFYTCIELPVANCQVAAASGLLKGAGTGRSDKLLYYCDMRLQTDGSLKPSLCLPDAMKPTTAALTTEVLDADGRVVAFLNPVPVSTAQFNELKRCDLTLVDNRGIKGSYVARRGCLQREGYTTVPAPYWDKSGATTVTACAIEAQTNAVNPATLQSCEGLQFTSDRACGCGVHFRRCEFSDGTLNLHAARVAAINEEPLRIVDSVVRRDEDYFNILTTRRSFLNSTLSEFYRERQGTGVWVVSPQAPLDALPITDSSVDPAQWVEYTRDENSSGVLTTPAFLYRFPTQRARVNEFYEAFLCKHFAPPADAKVPPADDACNRENNLAKRCGCNYCHATMEPAGAHWGRYGERNATFLDPLRFPRFDAKCRECALSGNTSCDGECSNYVMQALDGDGAASMGLLKTYLYRTPEEEPNIVGGPKLLVERMLQTGDLERCAVKNVWNEFIGRPMTPQEQSMHLEALTTKWITGGRHFKELIQLVITTDAYRRID